MLPPAGNDRKLRKGGKDYPGAPIVHRTIHCKELAKGGLRDRSEFIVGMWPLPDIQ